MSIARVVVVGAGPAGAHAAETLRARGFDGSVVVLGDEPFPPYERPALSKEFLAGSRSRDGLVLRAPGFWESRGIDLRLGTRVARIDYRSRTAVTGRGVAFPWDAIVLATGARARRLPLPAPPSVHVLRGIADAEALRTRLARGVRLAVVGGGFLGAEVASTATGLGCRVTMLDAGAAPLAGRLGRTVGALLADRFRDNGVSLVTGARVASIETGRRGTTLVLTNGDRLAADVVLVSIGAKPDRSLLTADPPAGVHVCGDVRGPGHWTSAAHDAVAAAHAILGLEAPAPQPRYAWSDQFGLRLQLVGEPGRAARVELDGAESSFTARYRDGEGRLLAVLLANRPDGVARARRELPLAA